LHTDYHLVYDFLSEQAALSPEHHVTGKVEIHI